MKRKPLRIHCVFPASGEPLRMLFLRSFSLYLRRVLSGDHDFAK